MPLTGKQRRALRARAHGLGPIVTVGAGGVSDAVLAEANRALDDHELVKVKIAVDDRETRREFAAQICAVLKAEHIQSLGKTAVIYREAEPQD